MVGLFNYFLPPNEEMLVQKIYSLTKKYNLDNISRTESYLHYYIANKEIRWAYLASQVSRNAGWNMCDLQGSWFSNILEPEKRAQLFFTYEEANWLIFQDAFPQLLLYDYSTKYNRPLFHLLKYFSVSSFMEKEWNLFWENRNQTRLMTSLIINEQNLIEKPIIKNPYYKREVFHSLAYLFQDFFHCSSVLFPTLKGRLYGSCVTDFTSLNKRIEFGKELANILFYPDLYEEFYQFSILRTHTGSRGDYERIIYPRHKRDTPILRLTYPVVKHEKKEMMDWMGLRRKKRAWQSPLAKKQKPQDLTTWYRDKQEQLHAFIKLQNKVVEK
ncbi:DUF2515 family protein [Niallia nealsonii]|uniref:DUF2515 domain-containing protein n=1 Tax=Niallia nealsonii TaxID=115979 RepID=A0A2N0Z3K2_9BACI|nr:DUF2515 family protein [Niallia nealsonii]PKG24092.1 DUF2515 domain-containing protein [Niallia nealsonii]